MTNNLISFDFNGAKIIFDSNTKLIRMTIPAATATTTTFNNTSDNSNYQVPVGKTFTILGFLVISGTNARIVDLEQSDAADTSTNAVIKISMSVPASAKAGDWSELIATASLPTIAAQKFVNITIDIASGQSSIVAVYGFES